MRVGPTDGFYGGEINQVGANVPYVYGGPNHFDFSVVIYNGTATVSYGGQDYADTYGDIEDANVYDNYAWSEFDYGAYFGIDSYPAENSVAYELTISGCVVEEPYKNLGQCISNKIKENCSEYTGQGKKDCIHEQIGICHDMFGVPSNHIVY